MISLSYHSPPYWGGAGGRALVFLISLSYNSPPYWGGVGGRASSLLISRSYHSPPYWGGVGGRALVFLISLSYHSPPYWGGAGGRASWVWFCAFDEPFHFLHRILCIQHRSAYSNSRHSRLHYSRNVFRLDTANRHNRQIDIGIVHLLYYTLIAFKSENRLEVFLCRSKSEGAASYVVGTLTSQSLNVVERVGCATYYIMCTEHASRFVYRHVVLAKMHAVGTGFNDQVHTVVENELGAVFGAQLAYFVRNGSHIVVGSVLHT